MVIYNKRQYILIACEQALPGALAAGREKEGELAPTSLEFEFHLQFPYGFPQLVCQISTNQRECKQTLKTRVIAAFSILYRLLECTYPCIQFPETILLYSDGGGSGDEIGRRAYSLVNILNVFLKAT